MHKYLRYAISAYISDDPRIWDEMLPPLQLAYNSAYHEALGVSPSEVMLGRRLNSPGELIDIPAGEYTQLGYVKHLAYIMGKTQQLIFNKILLKRDVNLQRSCKDLPTFTPNSLVGIWNPKVKLTDRSYKIQPHFMGPCKTRWLNNHY